MEKGYKRRIIIGAGLLGCLVLPAAGCRENTMQITVTDGQFKTEIAAEPGDTVNEVLVRAEIAVRAGDIVKPKTDTVLTAEDDGIVITRYAQVTVTDGETSKSVALTGKTVQDALDKENIVLSRHDYLNHSPEAYLTDGMEIRVIRRMAVWLNVDGENRECLTKAEDVGGLLAEQHIVLDRKDRITPGSAIRLSDGMRIAVERVSVKEIAVRESIPFETQVEYSASMYTDEEVEKTPGAEGEKEVIYQVVYVDGREESRRAVMETVLKRPVSQVVIRGTKVRRRIVSREAVDDCDGSGHGYYIIKWSDGTVEYQDY